MGDIGKRQREFEFEPLEAPSVPEPVHQPQTTPAPVSPQTEPVPA